MPGTNWEMVLIYSKSTARVLVVLGKLIKVARSEQKISQAELAERLQVSRQTVIAMEKGSGKVAVGVVFEAANLLGIPVVAQEQDLLNRWQTVLSGFEAILPSRINNKNTEVDDDF